jgi:hypothetical protein
MSIYYEVQGLGVKRNQKKRTWMTFERFSKRKDVITDCKRKRENHPQFVWRVIKVIETRKEKEVY